jgi:hypothetical protein
MHPTDNYVCMSDHKAYETDSESISEFTNAMKL